MLTAASAEPTLFVNERHPSAIMTGYGQFPIQVAMMLNGNGVLSPDDVAAFTALFVAAPETKRQRDALLAALIALVNTFDERTDIAKAMRPLMGPQEWGEWREARALIAECNGKDA